MAKFNISVSTTLYTTICVKADSEGDAINIARDLCFEEGSVAEDVVDGFENDYEAYRARNWDFSLDSVADESADTVN